MTKRTHQLTAIGATAVVSMLALSACGSSDPLEQSSSASGQATAPIVIGSQDYYSNEIIAETYAQALEHAGYQVDRQFRIGQREVYLPELEAGRIDLIPEYSGNLLQYWVPDTEARKPEDVYQALIVATPLGLQLLDQAEASDQDSYTVTAQFAEKWGLVRIEDLANVTEPLTLGGNSELETRPYGPSGLKEIYGIDVAFTPIEDSGGPLTLKALTDGDIQLANIYSSDPAIAQNDLVTLEDTKGLFLASRVVPVAADDLDMGVIRVINAVNAALMPADLAAMNLRSVADQLPAATIATDWLAEKGL